MESASERAARAERLAQLPVEVATEVIGQRHVIVPVTEQIVQAELGLRDPEKPLGSFIFLGPTGVGKTQLVKTLARRLSPQAALARWDMSEFQTKESVDVMLGRSSGDEGRFGAEIRRAGDASFLLFDEFEKAHPDLLDLFLQMLDDARLTVASGRTFDFRRKYVFLTSNLGAAAAARMRHNSDEAIEFTVIAHARQKLRPEFFNRVDQVAVFRRLTLAEQEKVCHYHVGQKLARLRAGGLAVDLDASVYQFLLGEGFSYEDGARPLQRTIEKFLNRPVVTAWTAGHSGGGRLTVNAARTGLEFAFGTQVLPATPTVIR